MNLLPGVSRWGFVNLGVRAVGEPLWACNVGGKGGYVGEGEVVVFCGRADAGRGSTHSGECGVDNTSMSQDGGDEGVI